MAKREIINVDEDVIKKMIAGDIPRMPAEERKVSQKDIPSYRTENYSHGDPENVNKDDTEPRIAKKKKGRLKYADIFFIQQKYAETKQTTVILDKRIYTSIRNILKTTDGITFANFINNVMIHHFYEYKEEMEELKKEYISKLYNENLP